MRHLNNSFWALRPWLYQRILDDEPCDMQMIAMKLLTLAIKLLHVRMNYLDQACDSISYSGMNRQRNLERE